MQLLRLIVTELRESCRKNLQITCYGDHISYCFYSGAGDNEIVVQIDGEDIVVDVLNKTWWESLKDVVTNVWNKFVGVLFKVVEKAAGALGISVPFLALGSSAFKVPGSQLGNFDAVIGKIFKITY